MKALSAAFLVPFFLVAFFGNQNPALPDGDESDLVELGRYLFFDPRLSGDGRLSCASCHIPSKGWADGEALSTSYPGSDGFRNTKSLLNASRVDYFYWDGRLDGSDAETQVRDSITETHFMNMDGRLMLERLKQIPEYVQLFSDALAQEPSFGGTLKAISAFEKTLVTGASPFDLQTMSEQAKQGKKVFDTHCSTCHSGPDFTDGLPHNLGVPDNPAVFDDPVRHATYRAFIKFLGVPGYMNIRQDVGHYSVTKRAKDMGAFFTPSLRQVADTAPYMHNGVLKTLEDVVAFYSARGPALSAGEQRGLVAFLHALSGPVPVVDEPSLPRYKAIDNWMEVRN